MPGHKRAANPKKRRKSAEKKQRKSTKNAKKRTCCCHEHLHHDEDDDDAVEAGHMVVRRMVAPDAQHGLHARMAMHTRHGHDIMQNTVREHSDVQRGLRPCRCAHAVQGHGRQHNTSLHTARGTCEQFQMPTTKLWKLRTGMHEGLRI